MESLVSDKESLQCAVCSSIWTRKKSRGRKPTVCPDCIKEQVVLHYRSNIMSAETSSKKSATKWVCPNCGQSVTVFVNLEYPPVCNNPSSHTSKRIEMQISGRKAQVA